MNAYHPACCSPLDDHDPLPRPLAGAQLISTRFDPSQLAADEADSLVARFPHYRTVGQNPGSLTRLTPLQANLLADLTGWGVLESAHAVRDVLE